MEQLWSRFKEFVLQSLGQKFKVFFPGVCMGFIGAQHLLWNGFVVSVVEYVLKFIGTVLMAFFSGLATCYASYCFDKFKTKKDGQQQKKRQGGRNNKAA